MKLRALLASSRLAARGASRNRGHFCVGCSSVCLTTVSVGLLMTILAVSPSVFLYFAETINGESDLELWPRGESGWQRLNYTRISQALQDSSIAPYHSPRFSSIGLKTYNPKLCLGFSASTPSLSNFTYEGPDSSPGDSGDMTTLKASARSACQSSPSRCMDILCAKSVDAYVWIIDSQKDADIGISTSWGLPPLPAGGIYINTRAANSLQVQAGDYIFVQLPDSLLPATLDSARRSAYAANSSILVNATFSNGNPVPWVTNVPFRIISVFDSGGTYKFPKGYQKNSVMVFELPMMLESLAPHIHPQYSSAYASALLAESARQTHYGEVSDTIFACPSQPRSACYMDSDFSVVARRLVDWAGQVSEAVGIDRSMFRLSQINTLRQAAGLSKFLGLVVSLVVILFCGLSCFLIYSLLLTFVQTQSHDLGILRMVGSGRSVIANLITLSALSYSLPAWVAGTVAAQALVVVARILLLRFLDFTIPWTLSLQAVVVSIFLAALVPLLSSLQPIAMAVSKDLHSSLVLSAARAATFTQTLDRGSMLAGLYGSLKYLVGSLVLSMACFLVYILLPESLAIENLGMLFSVFLGLIIVVIIGLVAVSFNLQPVLEHCVLYLIFSALFWEDGALSALIKKNLAVHRRNNQKTAAMLSLALGFIFFLNINLDIEIRSLQYRYTQSVGSDVRVSINAVDGSTGLAFSLASLNQIEAFCQSRPDLVLDWSYVSYPLTALLATVLSDTLVSNVGQLVSYPVSIVAVSPNYFDIGSNGPGTIWPFQVDPDLSAQYPSMKQQLYSAKGLQSAVLSANLLSALGFVRASSPTNYSCPFVTTTALQVDGSTVQSNMSTLYPLGFLEDCYLCTMTQYPTSSATSMLVSFPTYLQLAQGILESVGDIPIQYLLITATDPSNSNQIYNGLLQIIEGTLDDITTVAIETQAVDTIQLYLGPIFGLATVLVMLVSLFSLNTAMYSNIHQQLKEISILMAIGLSQRQLLRIFIYEAFIVLMVSLVLGAGIGLSVGYSMAAQNSVLVEVPVTPRFPTEVAGVAVVLSTISALAATWGPLHALVVRRSIIAGLKST
ncbi:uncharacterized protein BJ171DRAFT_532227 [Polychytrium aggregatum]|uniref:uncharacterized protein n=1 Tax=Polychytrium aggregatum TaxID=110093 RepID=UPI0022FE6779|nr:uncharacterized protein BJ171DRAFT_532227 [Polychytrium aggregatum]KAI9193233.1 hypothetical protein BJ171DRAFT_532227 [Polychytrium aggregatum]